MATYSFASGPTMLPPGVLEELRDGLPPVLELPFTGTAYARIQADAEESLRALVGLPDTHRVLFLPGGASAHFAFVAMNLYGGREAADYVDSGLWARRAMAEAAHWGRVRVVARSRNRRLPPPVEWRLSPDAAYLHVTTNETAEGLQMHSLPDPGSVPLVADMSADFLAGPLDAGRFGLIYASAQKNLGTAGLTVVVVREDLLGRARAGTPAPFDYARQAAAAGRVSTPPTAAVYVAGRMLNWTHAMGGLAAMGARSRRKAERLYAAIDDSGFYRCPVAPPDRSRVNVCFHLPTPRLEAAFAEEAEAAGLLHLKGHPAVGGLRANLYNAVPEEAVEALAAFMDAFARRWG